MTPAWPATSQLLLGKARTEAISLIVALCCAALVVRTVSLVWACPSAVMTIGAGVILGTALLRALAGEADHLLNLLELLQRLRPSLFVAASTRLTYGVAATAPSTLDPNSATRSSARGAQKRGRKDSAGDDALHL